MKSLPMARRCSRSASSIYVLMVDEGVDNSGAGNYTGLAAEGEFACVSTIGSSLAMGRWSLAFRMGVMSSEEFWARLLLICVEIMTFFRFDFF